MPGVGPKRALQLASELGITSAGELAEAASSGRLRNLPGFGPKTEEAILRGIGVAATDTALRTALRALPDDAGADAIEAALAATVPAKAARARRGHPLIEVSDMRGDLHGHTTAASTGMAISCAAFTSASRRCRRKPDSQTTPRHRLAPDKPF